MDYTPHDLTTWPRRMGLTQEWIIPRLPDPDLLTAARHDFGPMIITPDELRANHSLGWGP